MIFNIDQSIYRIHEDFFLKVEEFSPKIMWALIILLIWAILSRFLYLLLISLFKKFKLNEFIDKLKINLDEEALAEEWEKTNKKIKKIRFTDKIKVDNVVAKSASYYLFIIFIRISISYIWITEIEVFLKDLIAYLPDLFIWVLIWFFWIRFSNFIYDVIYHTLNVTKQKTSKVIAYWWKIMILFFTLMLFLDYTKIVNDFIINTILIWFISMLALSWWLAFWLWWKDIAKEIIEGFRK